MKKRIVIPLLLLVSAFWAALPLLPRLKKEPDPGDTPSVSAPEQETEPPAQTVSREYRPAKDAEVYITLYITDTGSVDEISLAEYLPGVLAGEVPGDFEPEALRAQAVAARTCAMYKLLEQPTDHPGGATVCDDPGCCCTWLSIRERRLMWGEKYDAFSAAVEQAVASTDGECVFYDRELILAAFHCASPGATVSSGDVWLESLPYLVSVSSPESEALVPDYVRTLTVSFEDFAGTVRESVPGAEFAGAELISDPVYGADGRLKTVKIGGAEVTGAQLRGMFGLSSSAIGLEATGEGVVLTTTGSGHGAGLSQYGAQAMALSGSEYDEILEHYYSGAYVSPVALYVEVEN